MLIRSVISDEVGKNRKELRREIEEMEATLNERQELKTKACSIAGVNEREINFIWGQKSIFEKNAIAWSKSGKIWPLQVF